MTWASYSGNGEKSEALRSFRRFREQVRAKRRARLDGVTGEIRHALGGEHLLVEEEVPGARPAVPPQDRVRRIRHDLRLSAVPLRHPPEHRDRRGGDHRLRPQGVYGDPRGPELL